MNRAHLSAEAASRQHRLVGKVAVVTGIGSGIGKGCALMFARQGAKVIGCDISPQGAEAEQGRPAVHRPLAPRPGCGCPGCGRLGAAIIGAAFLGKSCTGISGQRWAPAPSLAPQPQRRLYPLRVPDDDGHRLA